ncbi:MAG: hypothetical protein ABI462_08525 [Ignavibacteria bacterium]
MKKLFPAFALTLLMLICGHKVFSQVTTVPAGASPYANLGAAFTAINAGGPYTGSAVTVTITANLVEPAAAFLNGGIFTSCLIRPNGVRTVTGSFAEAIIVLDGADNVTIDGLNTGGNSLTFNNLDAGLNAGSFRMSNGAQNNVVRNCTCMGIGIAASSGGRTINIGQSATAVGNNGNIIENNVVNGGRRGIQIFGTAALVTNDNNIVRNNIIKNISSLHIFIGDETVNTTISGNEIFNDIAVTGDPAVGGVRGINIQGVGTINVTSNRMHNMGYTAGTAIGQWGMLTIPKLLTAPGSNATTLNYINNFISLTDNNDPATFIIGLGIETNTIPYTSNVFNNSIFIGGVTASTIAAGTTGLDITLNLAGSITNVANNIAINGRTGGTTASQHIADDESALPFAGVTFNTDYNFSKATDTTGRGWDGGYAGRLFRFDGGLELMKDTACINGNGQHNMYKPAIFVSSSNLHLAGPIGGDMCGKPLAAVTVDIDGATRSSTYPYRGADEGPALKTFTMGGCLEGAVSSDQVTVILKTGACGVISSCTADITSGPSGTVVFCFGDSVGAGPYYIDVQNRNHLETYSATTVAFGAATIYDFKPARATAFGSNLTVAGPPFCFYGGDVNKDGIINLADLLKVSNDVTSFVTGCRKRSDITNNGTVNLADLLITSNNNTSFVNVAKPCPEPSYISTFNENQNLIQKQSTESSKTINKLLF